MENLTITAAIIVKNEERCISRCISSVVNVVDEIIIVDTGSDDNTIDIINNFENNKIRLYSAGWHQSFSAARNTAIEKATCDYIFFIDADEYLQKPEVSIHRLIIYARVASQENNIVFCPRISDHNGNTTSSLRRFFPNNMGYNCSFPAPVYGPDTSTPTGSGTCVPPGWNVSAGRYCNWDPSNDNDVCY
ncbi:glycosyltransferase [Salmonella enterica]|nr:glycosyltransferase [Salmonella enterica]EGZ6497397.1 glycosyltransferase [Salmonella enterica]